MNLVYSVYNYPLLSAEEELDLARRYKYQNDLKAAEKLVISHLRYVASLTKDLLGYGLPQEDLFQAGVVGLMIAVKKFDPERGVRLASYATHWILSKMKEFIQNNVRQVKTAVTKAQTKLFWNRSVVNEHTTEETAKILGVPEKTVLEYKSRCGKDLFIDQGSEEDERDKKQDWLASQDLGPEEEVIEADYKAKTSERLKSALAQLEPRRRRVVEARWLTEAPLELKELSKELGVSIQRIQQLEVDGIKRLRKLMGVDNV